MRNVVVFLGTVLVFTVLVVSHAGAGGGEGSYTFLEHQAGDPSAPVTYSSCKPIRVQINTDGVEDKDAAKQAVLGAMGEVSAATGLHVVYAGSSNDRVHWPAPELTVVGGERPVLVAFARGNEVRELEGHAGVAASSSIVRAGVETYVTGQVAIDADTFDRPGGQDEAKAIAMHELGHIVGLGHVKDRGEIMYTSGNGKAAFGPGDRRGLALLGKGPCS